MTSPLALHGGKPVRATLLPYGRQSISDEDIAEVTRVLKSDFLTTGPEVAAFEKAFAEHVGAAEAVAVCNGTAALHCAVYALDIGPGDEVIIPVMTMAATANAVLMQGATPVLTEINPDTLLMNPEEVKKKINKKTKAVLAVDYAGQPADYAALHAICDEKNIPVIGDACHSLGATQQGKPAGSLTDLTAFSFHPVKPITTGEGGMIVTENKEWAARMRRFRHHNISIDPEERKRRGNWFYAIEDLGYNYRLTDIQCALGRSQLKHVEERTIRRQEIAKRYDAAFVRMPGIRTLRTYGGNTHAHHLYVIRWTKEKFSADRDTIYGALQAEGIGVNLHYIPIHLLSYHGKKLNLKRGDFPLVEEAYDEMLTLPLFSSMSDQDADDVVEAVRKVHAHFTR